MLVQREAAKSKKKKKRLQEQRIAALDVKRTGWPEGLLQDDSKDFSRWLSTRLDAGYIIRKRFNEDSLH